MQKRVLKFLISLSLLLAAGSISAQIMSRRLHVADSLFLAKKYTQSFEHYEAILKNNEYTESMLLRMALIQEGLGEAGKALYYLNLYYLASGDLSAHQKMTELAAKYSIYGYEDSDRSKFLGWYYHHHASVSISLAVLCLFCLALVFYFRRRQHQRPIGSAIMLALFLVALFFHLNFGGNISVAIVETPNTYVMKGPSAGADVMEILGTGHRVDVIDKKDVWLKILWRGSVAYVKQGVVRPVTLSR